MINFKNVTKRYNELVALKNINLELPETGLVVLKGKNGSGKSTIINLIGCLDTPTEGKIEIKDVELSNKNEEERRIFREENIGFIFQENNLFEDMTVKDNLEIIGKSPSLNKVAQFLEIGDLLNKKAKELSGGEQQRVAIARALLKSPKIILADEPTSSIDEDSRLKILGLLKKLSENALVILVIHESEHINNLADTIITLDEGKIMSVEKFSETPNTNIAKSYKCQFSPVQFSKKNLLINKKGFVRICLLLIISLEFILIAASLSTVKELNLHTDTIVKEKDGLFIIDKYKLLESGERLELDEFEKEDIDYIKNEYTPNGKILIGKAVYIAKTPILFKINQKLKEDTPMYYNTQLRTPVFFDIKDLDHLDYGRMPEEKNEVVISSYLAEQIIYYGMETVDGTYYYPENFEQLLNDKKEFKIFSVKGNITFVVSGIRKMNLDKYEELKDKNYEGNKWSVFNVAVNHEATDLYVKDEFFEDEIFKQPYISSTYTFSLDLGEKNPYGSKYDNFSKEPFTGQLTLDDGTVIETLREDEVILGANFKEHFQIGDTINIRIHTFRTKDVTIENLKNLKVVGFTDTAQTYFNQNLVKEYTLTPVQESVLKLTELNSKNVKKLLKNLEITSNGKYEIFSNYSLIYENIREFIFKVSILFTVLSIVFGLLAILYLFNYISSSISAHKKDIAILKSLGIKSKQILFSFTYEICVITITAYCYTLVMFFALRILINYVAENIMGFKFNLVPISTPMIILVIVVALIINFLISLKGNKKISKTDPQILMKKNIL